MKALFLTNEYPPNVYGGAGVHVEYLSRELASLIDLEVRCFGDQQLDRGRLRVRGYEIPAGLIDEAPDKLRSPLGTLARNVAFSASDAQAEIVHCHTWYSHFGGVLGKLLYGQKLVLTTHSLEPLRPWKREQLGRGYDLSSWIERTALTMADAIVAVSEETKRDVLEHFDVPAERVQVIPNGIDLHEYQRNDDTSYLERYGVPRDLDYVLFVGRITRQKGIIHLLHAAEQLDPEVGIVLCAGAPDTKEIADEMQALIDGLRARRANVHWIAEMVPKQAAIQLYSHAKVFCCPSIYEPFGIINLEAMACETPIVASAVGGIKEIIIPEKTGILVPFEQQREAPFEPVDAATFASDLAAGINRLMRDDELRAKMAKAGRARAEERYGWGSIAKRTVELYKSLL
ncbi:MAG: glycogen synthase [Proteobacteria bacterium]|nr:MAG: glycogen synthase [Pseudomonadota bacterium]PIE17637.1 MAG: glycogen synthase [Pseudomonadota bacterium]